MWDIRGALVLKSEVSPRTSFNLSSQSSVIELLNLLIKWANETCNLPQKVVKIKCITYIKTPLLNDKCYSDLRQCYWTAVYRSNLRVLKAPISYHLIQKQSPTVICLNRNIPLC